MKFKISKEDFLEGLLSLEYIEVGLNCVRKVFHQRPREHTSAVEGVVDVAFALRNHLWEVFRPVLQSSHGGLARLGPADFRVRVLKSG